MNMFDCFAHIGAAWAKACLDAHIALFDTLASITPTATKYQQYRVAKRQAENQGEQWVCPDKVEVE